MFCFQCEQTAGCNACTGVQGVCGKKADTAQLQDELTGALIGLARATEGNEDLVNETTNQIILESLFTTITNVNFNNETVKVLIDKVQAEKKRLVPNCFACASSCGRTDNFDMQLLWQEEEDIRSLKALILCGIRGMAAYAYHAAVLEYTEKEVMDFFYQALVVIGMKDCGMAVLMPVVIETGKMHLKCIELLNKEKR